MKPSLYYPVKQPINQTNLFGANPALYKPFNQAGHPGNDFEAPSGTPVYAPCDGAAFYTSDSLGGDGIWIRTPDNVNPAYTVILWHLWPKGNAQYPFKIPTDGSVVPVKAGQLLGYSDNSGAPQESTGPHLHLGIFQCDGTGEALNPNNGYLGCVDPAPFYNGEYAQDINLIPAATAIVEQAASIVTQITQSPTATPTEKSGLLDAIKKVVQLLESIL